MAMIATPRKHETLLAADRWPWIRRTWNSALLILHPSIFEHTNITFITAELKADICQFRLIPSSKTTPDTGEGERGDIADTTVLI